MPGGHIGFGETIFTAAKRESLEEVGLGVKPIGVFGMNENVPKDPTRKHYILFHIICSADSTDVKIDGKELVEYAWLSQEESMNLLHASAYKEIIREYANQSKKGKIEWVFTPSP